VIIFLTLQAIVFSIGLALFVYGLRRRVFRWQLEGVVLMGFTLLALYVITGLRK
jgi:hypothetical protein